MADYRSIGLSLARPSLRVAARQAENRQSRDLLSGSAIPRWYKTALGGMVMVRQRPGTAKGTVFITIEDETGIANIIIWPSLVQSLRNKIIGATLLIVEGRLQRSDEGVTHIIVERLADRSNWLAELDGPDAAPPTANRAIHARNGLSARAGIFIRRSRRADNNWKSGLKNRKMLEQSAMFSACGAGACLGCGVRRRENHAATAD